jgi:Nucleotidyl transferase AbiEii toxin, Type IV TA system
MGELDPFQAEIARLALKAAEGHGFALAGSNALAVHGIIARPTEDVDLFTDADNEVQSVAPRVAAKLEEAGFAVQAVTHQAAVNVGEVRMIAIRVR